jgi:hypothetical protein
VIANYSLLTPTIASVRSIGSTLSLSMGVVYFTVALTAGIFGVHFTRLEGAFPLRKKEKHTLLVSVSQNN